jgi:hypothetical protein
MQCQICQETFPEEGVSSYCNSPVAHNLCHSCEGEWRSKMPLQDDMRTMNCPTCREPEKERTKESLAREVARLNRIFAAPIVEFDWSGLDDLLAPTRPSVRRRSCESGRDCQSRSRSQTRTITHLKCRSCNVVYCCRNCRICIGCG